MTDTHSSAKSAESKIAELDTRLRLQEQKIEGIASLSVEVKRVDSDVKSISEEMHVTHVEVVSHLKSIDCTLKKMQKNTSEIGLLKDRVLLLETQKKTFIDTLLSLAPAAGWLIGSLIMAYTFLFDQSALK